MKKITKQEQLELAEVLCIDPAITAEIFNLAAGKVRQAHIAEKINEAHNVNLTETIVRKIIHRQKPFCAPEMFSEVSPEDEQEVVSRFRKSYSPRKTKKKVDNGPEKHLPVLLDVLTARVEYQKKLQLAVDAGMSQDAVIAWVSVVAEGDLEAGSE
jgi:hypothetical protein